VDGVDNVYCLQYIVAVHNRHGMSRINHDLQALRRGYSLGQNEG
jgi:hypothetical protein